MSLTDDEALAAEAFMRRRNGPWTEADERAQNAKLAGEPAYADACRRVSQAWRTVGDCATSPEMMLLREQAISRVRRANARRWLGSGPSVRARWRVAAAASFAMVALGVVIQLSPFGYRPGEYHTGTGEQRVVELDDHSRIALDSETLLRVDFTDDARTVRLLRGQAQFSVAKDPARPFKVEAGGHTIVAVGTAFTVEYVDQEIHVAMLEGKVAVLPPPSLPPEAVAPQLKEISEPSATVLPVSMSKTIELVAGEELRVSESGQAVLNTDADLEAATAWREGKVIFHSEPLGEAVRRLNRYSRLQLEIEDAELRAMQVSGVFEAGDTHAFAEALESYLPVSVDYSTRGTIRLRVK